MTYVCSGCLPGRGGWFEASAELQQKQLYHKWVIHLTYWIDTKKKKMFNHQTNLTKTENERALKPKQIFCSHVMKKTMKKGNIPKQITLSKKSPST